MMGTLSTDTNSLTDKMLSSDFSCSDPFAPDRYAFKYFKSQELPLFFYDAKRGSYSESPSIKQLKNDYAELEVTIHDNGDDKVFVEVALGPSKHIALACEMYLPILGNQGGERIMIAAAGNTVILKEIKAKIVQR